MAKKTLKKKSSNSKVKTAATEVAPALPVGTLVQKTDRHGKVRCECTVEAEGYRYGKTVYKSLSAAAVAAAKDLGLVAKSLNGYVFWGLRKPLGANPLDRVDRLWKRYSDVAVQLAKDPQHKPACLEQVRRHVSQLQSLVG